MKRCPLCEFIYEDEQSLCDMDGIALVASPEALAIEGISATEPVGYATISTRSRAMRLFITAVAGVVLGLVLVLVYSVSNQRARMRVTSSSPAQVAVDSQSPAADSTTAAPLAQPLDSTQSPEPPKTPETRESPARDAIVITDSPEGAKPLPEASQSLAPRFESKSKPGIAKPKPQGVNLKGHAEENTNTKKDSAVGSILKKAANILKKPFKH